MVVVGSESVNISENKIAHLVQLKFIDQTKEKATPIKLNRHVLCDCESYAWCSNVAGFLSRNIQIKYLGVKTTDNALRFVRKIRNRLLCLCVENLDKRLFRRDSRAGNFVCALNVRIDKRV